MSLDGFKESSFSYDGQTRTVYRRGTGPGVIVMHELRGITPQVASLGRRIAGAGLTSVLPVLFGTPGKPMSAAYFAGQLLRVCISREFACLAKRKSSPITEWLRALCRRVHQECGGPGVGAIGMCITGSFVLSLMVNEHSSGGSVFPLLTRIGRDQLPRIDPVPTGDVVLGNQGCSYLAR